MRTIRTPLRLVLVALLILLSLLHRYSPLQLLVLDPITRLLQPADAAMQTLLPPEMPHRDTTPPPARSLRVGEVTTATEIPPDLRYNPPPTVSPQRLGAIGRLGTQRGERYATELTLRVGSFTQERDRNAFWEGITLTDARSSLLREYPEVEPVQLETLTESNLADLDLFILAIEMGSHVSSNTLSPAELAALRGFAEAGGWLLLVLDPGINNFSANMREARVVAQAFGVEVLDVSSDPIRYRPIDAPHRYRLTTGPWGHVNEIWVKYPLSFGDLGPHAQSLSINNHAHPMLALIEPGALAPGSGLVLLLGDLEFLRSMERDHHALTHNDILFFNLIDLALQAKAHRRGNPLVPAPEARPAITPSPTAVSTRVVMPPFPDHPANQIGGSFAALHRGVDYMTDTPLRIGTFEIASISRNLQKILQAAEDEYPEISHTTFETLTSEAATTADLLILDTERDQPLSTAEQQVLYDHVASGGCAVLSLKHPGYRPDAETRLARLVQPFGLELTIPDHRGIQQQEAPQPFDPSGQPILDGPWGLVEDLHLAYLLAITQPGPHGEILIPNRLGGEVLFIQPDALAPGSGPVLVTASGSFWNMGLRSYDNDFLVFNTLDFCHQHLMARMAS